MRFRKSVRICKGVRINFSKSGASITAGMPGLSMNVGSKGTYINTGIPGTGLYDRKKISGNSRNSRAKTNVSYSSSHSFSINLHVDEHGILTVRDSNNREITDTALLRKIKATDEFKKERERLMNQNFQDINGETENISSIYKMCPDVATFDKYTTELEQLELDTYAPKIFSERPPIKDGVRYRLEKKADETITSWKFWEVKKLKEHYVQENLEKVYSEEYEDWSNRKNAFEKNELQIEIEKNARFLEQYNEKKQGLEKAINGDTQFIDDQIAKWLSTVSLPVDFSLDFEYESSLLMLDLDLPEIEDLPKEKATRLANGTTKKKSKTQKELKAEYAQCVFGLAVFFAANLFNISPRIENMIVSGYTQRKDPKTLVIKDDYIYSVKFDRKTFEATRLKEKNPQEFCMTFENITNITSTMIFKTIVPY